MEARGKHPGDPSAMATQVAALQPSRCREIIFGSKIERLLDWTEPIIRRICLEVWRRYHPRGLEMEDLCQEARIEVYLQAEHIIRARNPEALTATVVRRRAMKVVRKYTDRHTPLSDECSDEATADNPEKDFHSEHAPL